MVDKGKHPPITMCVNSLLDNSNFHSKKVNHYEDILIFPLRKWNNYMDIPIIRQHTCNDTILYEI